MQRLFFAHPDPTAPRFDPQQVYSVPELAFPTTGVEMELGEKVARRPYIYFNMVSSADGKATTAAGNAAGLGDELDHQMMYRLRAASDAVLCGAATFRKDPFLPAVKPWLAEERARFFPDAPQIIGAVISRDGNLPLDKKFWEGGKVLRVVFLGQQASDAQTQRLSEKARVYRVQSGPDGEPDLAQILALLYEMGVKRLLVEGGPTLNYSFISRGLGDELFWTLAPKLVGGIENQTILAGPGRGFPLEKLVNLQLLSIYYRDNELFMRYRLLYPPES